MTLDEIRIRMGDLRGKRADARERLERITVELSKETDEEAANALRDQVKALRDELKTLRDRETTEIAVELNPLVHVPVLDGAIPILLAPLRIHTRFDRRDNALLIRVYPDDCSIQNHESRLSQSERAAGNSFWAAPEVSPNEVTPSRREVWRGIVSRFGLRRAAWIMRATDPDGVLPGEDIDQPVRIPAAWTLPERLVFLLYGDGDLLLNDNLIGTPIPDGLEMSFDVTRPNMGFVRAGGDLDYPPELQWQVDFSEAIKVGMGISVPLDRIGNPRVIRRLVVLGVRLSSDEQQSAELLEDLIESHRYTEGFSIVSQGTPSNITQDSDMPAPPDADAALAWLTGKGGFAPDGQGILYDDEPDGLRLAHALGIEPEKMRFIENSGCSDAREAIAMKRALWAGTFGYYIQQMLQPQLKDNFQPPFPSDSPERLILAARFYFTNFVFGRGPLPAFRVGSQPYGVLPVCADMLKRSDPRQMTWNDNFLDAFVVRLHDKMITLSHTWIEQISNVAQAGPGPNANARLLDVLATQASSVEWHMERLIGRQYLHEYADFKGKQTAFDQFAFMLGQRFALFQNEYPNLLSDWAHIFDLTIFGGYWKTVIDELDVEINNLERGATIKLNGDVIDNFPLSEKRPIDEKYPNYIDWMSRSRFERIRQGLARTKPNGDLDPVRSLLFIALRYSYLYEHTFTAMRFHARYQNKTWNQFLEKELYNLGYEYDLLPWDLVSEVKPNWQLGGIAPTNGSVLNFIENREDLKPVMGLSWRTMFGDIDEMLGSLRVLAGLPTAGLERLFAEHMDLASYRLDAWFTAYAFERLVAYRVWRSERQANRLNPLYEQQADRPPIRFALNNRPLGRYSRGIYLGAYGWVENLQADAIGEVVENLPQELTPRNRRPVTRDADNYGLIHAPSINQAVTAAMLRSASVTQPDVAAFNIDLSSTRTRDALWMMEGVRNGQMPAALLGYRFERRLRELDVKLLGYLPDLRVAFPMPRQPDTDPGPQESITARDVVNGLLIIQARRDGTLGSKLTAASIAAADRTVMTTIADELIDTFDACGDLMIAESAHHAAQGNYERAGGVVTAAGEFSHVPAEFDVVATPRGGTALSHRILLAFEAGVPVAPGAGSPRSRLEPGLNRWIGSLIGDQSKLVCFVSYVFSVDGEEKREKLSVTLDQLGLEPIDLLYVVDDRSTDELGRRLDRHLRPQFVVAHPGIDVSSIEVDLFAKGPAGTRPAGEVIQFLYQVRSLLSASSPATLRDFVAAKALHGLSQSEMDGIDENELMQRVLGVRRDNPGIDESSLWSTFSAAKALFDPIDGLDPGNDAGQEAAFAGQIEVALLAASQFGIAEAVPRPPKSESRFKSLKAQASGVKSVMNARFDTAAAKWNPVTPPEKSVLQTCRDVTEALLGGGFPLMPRDAVPAEFSQSALELGDPGGERTSDWLFLAASVREDADKLHRVRVLCEEFDRALPTLQVFQWPETQKAWIAEAPPPGVTFEGDLTSIVVQSASAFDAAQAASALIIDEWQEVIPGTHETTGIAFHYDAPNAEPPQALLLAVSERRPNNNLRWMWDELVDCVNQALVLGKMRAVGPDQLRSTRLDTVLPATLAAEAAIPATIVAGFISNIDVQVAKQDMSIWTEIKAMTDFTKTLVKERLEATTAEIDKRLHTVLRLPTAVTWNRLEGRPRSDDLSRPLRAEVRDPAWMLARQWQLGEFEGQDAGAPIVSKLLAETTPLEENPLGVPASIPYDENMPVEVVVERQIVDPGFIMGLYIGRRWVRTLTNEFGAGANAVIASFLKFFAVTAPEGKTLESLELKANQSEYGLRKALAARSLDGAALIASLRKARADGVSPSVAFGNRGVVIAVGQAAAIDTRSSELLAWFESKFGKPEENSPYWTPSRLEYDFSMCVTENLDKQTRLVADQFNGGRVDWYSFDTRTEAAPQGAQPAPRQAEARSFVPVPVRFFGMPNVRWWEFEDDRVGFGITTASKTDLVKMLLAEFGLVFSNDWFLLPLRLKTGTLIETKGIVVTDNFGLNTLVEPVAKRHRELHLAGNWSMWTLASRNNPGQVDPRLFLAPAVNRSIDSRPVDEVLFLRDEMANLVWGVETVIPDAMGGGRDARFVADLVSKGVRDAFPFVPQNEVAGVPIFYRLMGSVRENWIPLVAVKADGEATATLLLQGAMPRLPVIEPARDDANNPILKNNVVLPRGTILSQDPVGQPNVIHEEEILRDGILVRRHFRQTRWTGGQPFTWCSFEKQSGRGEGSSGLAFDQAIEKPPTPVP